MHAQEKIADDTYKCCLCGGVFIKGRSHEEALAEYETNFPGKPFQESEIVCDDCYNIFMRTK